MRSFTHALGAGLLLTATVLHAGCGSNASGLAADAPKIAADDPLAKPIQVAWTSARAQRCGFYFDPAKLRSAYIATEQRQAGMTTDQLAKIQVTYDKAFKATSEQVSADPDYCTDRKGNEIKADLQRHLAGDYTPNLPKTKQAAKSTDCGFFGCSEPKDPNEKLDTKKLFEDMEKKRTR